MAPSSGRGANRVPASAVSITSPERSAACDETEPTVRTKYYEGLVIALVIVMECALFFWRMSSALRDMALCWFEKCMSMCLVVWKN